ncbi:ArnT family glycosyltransferase [Falsiroseomonas sp.]|uniref:ArnT family glycosyltransferase n=1 Tax=Falsiroseomonas sp. TaxID=2870721 RepID=UPI00356346B8
MSAPRTSTIRREAAAGTAGAARFAELLAVLLAALLGAVLLFLTAPTAGEFWWSDAPRHGLNGVFVRDLVAAMPWRDPVGYAMQYYVQYPALTILFYPPLFYAISAVIFAVFGFSHAVALGAVLAHYVVLAVGLHLLARRFMGPGLALAVAMLAMAAPGIALWGRQVMLEVPSMAFAVWAMLMLRGYAAGGPVWRLALGLFLLLCAIYTKFSAVFLIPVAGLMLLAADPRRALTRRAHWLAALAFLVALAPAVLLTLKFGAANLQSVTSIPDAPVARWTLEGWTWYARALPGLLGWPLLAASLAGLLLALRRTEGADGPAHRADLALLLGWIGIGYVFLSYIDLKEARHATLLLPPFLIAAGIAAKALPRAPRLAAPAAAGLLAATAAITLWRVPVPFHDGYREAAEWIGQNAPPNAIVVFSGKRDGSFVFSMRANADRRPDIFTVRADKLLLSISVRRQIGVTQRSLSEEEIGALLDRVGATHIVAQSDFWTDLEVMDRLQRVLRSPRFVEVARIPVRSNQPEEDRELRIYRNTNEVAPAESRLSIDLPIIGRSVQGNVPSGR